jgi:hypothetical protein
MELESRLLRNGRDPLLLLPLLLVARRRLLPILLFRQQL